jgi:hypothetical protein
VDAAPFADRLGGWLPDLMRAGARRVTLFHAIESEGPECALELDALRPKLDRLAVQLSTETVEVELALKRGDRTKWLVSLATLRASQLIVLGPHCSRRETSPPIGPMLRQLLDDSPCPLLVITRPRRPGEPGLFDHPVVLEPKSKTSRLGDQARAVVPSAFPLAIVAPNGGPPAGTSLLVTGRTPARGRLEELLVEAPCPVLVIPAHADAIHT